MWAVSDAWDDALRTTYKAVCRGEVWRDNVKVSDLDVVGGQVQVSEGRDVRRSLTLSFSAREWAAGDLWSLLSPDDTDIRVWAGQQRVDGSEEYVPVGWFRVSRPSRPSRWAAAQVEADDYASVIKRARFVRPWVTAAGAGVVAEITAIIHDVDPSIEVVDATGQYPARTTGAATEDTDRWGRIQALAKSIGCEAAFDPIRRFVIRPTPEVDPTADPDWIVDADDDRAVLLDYSLGADDPGYNAVVASSSAGGDAAPVSAIAYASTWRAGVKNPRFYASPLLDTVAKCLAAARSILLRSRAFARILTPSAPPNYALDSGDQIRIVLPADERLTEDRIVTGFSFDLGVPSGPSPIETRTTVDISETLDVGELS